MMRSQCWREVATAYKAQTRCVSVKPVFPDSDLLESRHNALSGLDEQIMLKEVNARDMDTFLKSVIPASILKKCTLPEDGEILGETRWLDHFRTIMSQNVEMKQCIGMGYHECKVPPVIIRNVIESPGWYTPYTPYQAEISQGRLESLMNFQQVVMDLTGFNLANASLLDEATAVGEALSLAVQFHRGKRRVAFVDENLHPASIALAKTRGDGFNVEVVVGSIDELMEKGMEENLACVIVQYPDTYGSVKDYRTVFEQAKEKKILSVCVADLMSLTHLTPPGELGADVSCGTTQRLGVPMGYGGPHAAYFATSQSNARITPGRIIGVSRDREGNNAYRMALQTREQHIKREKATSNICTAQALLANVAAMYAVWHGPEGLHEIGATIHLKAKTLAAGLEAAGYGVLSESYFDTLHVKVGDADAAGFVARCCEAGINIRMVSEDTVCIALDECTDDAHLVKLLAAAGCDACDLRALRTQAEGMSAIPQSLQRTSKYLQHAVFNVNRSETAMMRYIYRLERKDLGLNTAMIPLGSCTMKLNAATEMMPLTWSCVNSLHPYVPVEQAKGYTQILNELEDLLSTITGIV